MSSAYGDWLAKYPNIVREMDEIYGGPEYKKQANPKGRNALFFILDYLSKKRKSTCEDIAKKESDNNPNLKRKIKSITDDVRKFIQINLIPRRLVVEDGFKKKYNKKVVAYSLTPFGILYSIHLLAKKQNDETVI